MSEFNPPIQRRIQENTKKLRNFVVPDGNDQESSSQAQFNSEEESFMQEEKISIANLKQLREEKLNPKISKEAKERIEMLLKIGKMTRDVLIDGVTYSLRTLTSKEIEEAIVSSIKPTDLQFGFESRRQALARSLYAINGNDISLLLGDGSLETRLYFVDQNDETIVSRLHEEYRLLTEESKTKYAIKTQAEQQEAVEDLKK